MMLKRIIPLILFAFTFGQVHAQHPELLSTSGINPLNSSSLVCPPGANPDAGTSTQSIDQAIFPTNQTDDVQFLCLGDSMDVRHFGGSLSGDPNPATSPGFSYIFYRCPPSDMFDGPDFSNILMDPCHYEPAPATNLVTVQPQSTPINANGDATFFNDGSLQAANGGGPIPLWFAPFTADEFVPGPMGTVGVEGDCIDVNTQDDFNVVYLNAIVITNIVNDVGGNGCNGEMKIDGGLAEFLAGTSGSQKLYTVSITKVGDPSVVGFPTGGWEHGETNTFRVPEAGTYDISVEDGVSCGATAQVVMGSCVTTDFSFGDSISTMGSNICMPLIVENFTDIISFEFFIEWDPTILSYSGLMTGDLDDAFLAINHPQPGPGSAKVNWIEPNFGISPVSLIDGQTAFEICFDVIGMPGQMSPVGLGDQDFEVGTVNSIEGSYTSRNGSVTIVSVNMTLAFTSCASLSTAANDVGSFTVTVTGGVGPYTFTYVDVNNAANNGSGLIPMTGGTGSIMDLPPGEYLITVTDNNGDIQVGTVIIEDAPPLVVQISAFSNPTCENLSDGTLSMMSSGGIAPLAIEWSTGTMNQMMITGLSGGQYDVSVTDANGCVERAEQGLISPAPITIDTIIQHVSCDNGPSDGSITVVPSGGPSTNYTFLWDNTNTTNTITNLPSGTYCVAISSGGANCTSSFCIDVFDTVPPTIDGFNATPVSCPGQSDGALTVLYTPGFGTITEADINWDNGSNGSTLTGLSAGTYIVTVNASDGCSATDTFTIIDGGFSVTLNVMDPTCSDINNGFISATITPPPAPGSNFTYQWSNGGTGSFISDLACGETYSVTVSDGSACNGVVESSALPCPPDIIITFDPNSIEGVSCFGLNQPLCDGEVLVIASSGTTNSGDYSFVWDNSPDNQFGGSQHSATQLCQGWNTVSVSDAACTSVDSIFIPAPLEILLNLDSNRIERPSCFGDSDGSISIAAMGGTPPYQYNWDIGVAGQMIDNLPMGSYTVSVTDFNNCPYQVTIPLGQPDELMGFINPDNTSDTKCNDSNDGQIEVAWTGGNLGPATFDWSPDVSSSNFASNLSPGLYTVTITDQKGCSDEVTHVISNPPPILFEIDPVAEPLCFGETTVVTIASISGGSGIPYTFSAGGGTRDTSEAIRVLAGPITVTVFDSEKCSADTNIIVNQPPEILVNLGPEIEEIDLGSSYVIDAQFSPPNIQLDDLIWSPTDSLDCLSFRGGDSLLCDKVEVSPNNTTLYSLTAVDINGCEGSSSILIDVDKNRNVFIPNAFSPNGDGFNDEFRVVGGAGVKQVNYMRIYSRWGELMYEADAFLPLEGGDKAWDGRFKGKQMNPGVYVYLIEVAFIDNITLLYRGDITVIY